MRRAQTGFESTCAEGCPTYRVPARRRGQRHRDRKHTMCFGPGVVSEGATRWRRCLHERYRAPPGWRRRTAASADACVYLGCCVGDHERDCRPPPPSVRGGGPCSSRSGRSSQLRTNLPRIIRPPVQPQQLRGIQLLVSAPDQWHLDLTSDEHDAGQTPVRLWMVHQISS